MSPIGRLEAPSSSLAHLLRPSCCPPSHCLRPKHLSPDICNLDSGHSCRCQHLHLRRADGRTDMCCGLSLCSRRKEVGPNHCQPEGPWHSTCQKPCMRGKPSCQKTLGHLVVSFLEVTFDEPQRGVRGRRWRMGPDCRWSLWRKTNHLPRRA